MFVKQKIAKSEYSLFHTTYIKDTKELFKGLFSRSELKRFSNEIGFKFSKNVELKAVNDPKIA